VRAGRCRGTHREKSPQCLPTACHRHPALAGCARTVAEGIAPRRRFADASTPLNHAIDAIADDAAVEHADGNDLMEWRVGPGGPQPDRQCAFDTPIWQLPIDERRHRPEERNLAAGET